MSRATFGERLWYGSRFLHWPLIPLSLLFSGLSALRRFLYRCGFLRRRSLPVPVIVVGNITAGGTGKTPLTIWLVLELKQRGFRPGVISRGYGARTGKEPVRATANSNPAVTGDEPVLIATRAECPVVVHPDRIAAGEALVSMGVDVVIADDGLQHYRLQRQFEIAVVDGVRGFGNGWRLPAGPLRESPARLATVDRVLVNLPVANSPDLPGADKLPAFTSRFQLVPHELERLDGNGTAKFEDFAGRPVHAVAAIGNPERFFQMLEAHGLVIRRHSFDDHADLREQDIEFADELAILMTEKDAVKCRSFARGRHWVVPVEVAMHDSGWLDGLVHRLRNLTGNHTA